MAAGIDDLRSSLREISQATREAQDHFNDLRNEIKQTESETEQLAKELEALSKDTNGNSNAIREYTENINKNNKKVNELTAAYVALSSETTDLNATFEDMNGEMKPLSARMGEMEDRLYELALAGKQNTQEFRDLTSEAVLFRQTIIDVDRQVDLFAENRGAFGPIATQFSTIGDKLSQMDFEGAAQEAAQFKTMISSLSGATVLKGFKDLVSTIGQVGKAFLSVGKALLSNPLFLLAAIIAAVVIAIVTLKDKIKIIGDVFDLLMKPIDALIQGLKDLSDWLGFTSFAADEAATKQIASNDAKAKSYSDTSNKIIDSLDKEIRMARINGEDTVQLEIEKQKSINYYANLKAKALEDSIATTKEQLTRASKDEKEELQKRLDELKSKLKEEVTIRSNSSFEIRAIKAADKAADDAQTEKDDTAALAKAKATNDKRIQLQKEYNKLRLDTARSLKDLELSELEDGLEKDLAINEEKYRRQLEDLKVTGVAKLEAINLFNEQKRIADNNALIKSNAELAALDKERQDREDEQYLLLQETTLSKEELEIFNLTKSYDDKFLLAEGNKELTIALEEQQKADLAEINDKYRDEEAAKEKEAAKETADNHKKLQDAKIDAVKNTLSTIGNLAILFAGKSEKQQKRAFEIQKAANIASATMDTYKAATGAYASLSAIPVVGPALGAIAAGAAIAAGLVNVKNIASQKFSGGGSAPTSSTPDTVPNTISGDTGRSDNSSSSPSFNLFGKPGDNNNVGGTNAANGNQNSNITVTAIVSETEMTATQNKINKIENSAVL